MLGKTCFAYGFTDMICVYVILQLLFHSVAFGSSFFPPHVINYVR